MGISDATKTSTQTGADFDRVKELKAFDDTKAGVKGLVDAGIVNIPRIFIRPPEELAEESTIHRSDYQVPVIDLAGIRGNKFEEIVDQVQSAAEAWGFFQVVNHGVPLNVLEEMIDGVRIFNGQDVEMKKKWYTRDLTRSVRFNSNFDLFYSRTASWRDTLAIFAVSSSNVHPDELPEVCRDAAREYHKSASKLAETLFELLSVALGLKAEYLQDMGCLRGYNFVFNYYPRCPQPELTMGAARHTDSSFLTILLQDQIGGLQVLYENQWVDVPPVAGGLLVNAGDFLQIVSNGRFKSVEHRVVASHLGPRVSVACFFTGHDGASPTSYGPIKELTSEQNPPVYGEFLVPDYVSKTHSISLGECVLDQFKL